MVLLVCLVLALFPAIPAIPMQDKAADLPVEEILRKAVERAAWSDAQNFDRKYVSTFHSLDEEFDSNGSVKSHKERVVQMVPLGPNKRVGRTLERDGRPTTAAERKEEWDRQQKSIAEAQKRKQNRRKPADDDVKFDSAMVARYNWKLLGTETLEGRLTYLVSLEPKKDLPTHSMMDHLLNKVAGRVWFDAQEFEIVRADAHLTGDATLLGGLAASMKKADFFIEQTRMDDGAWLTRKMNVHIDARVAVVKTIREHHMEEHRDFRKVTPELIAEGQKPPVS